MRLEHIEKRLADLLSLGTRRRRRTRKARVRRGNFTNHKKPKS